MDSHISPRGLKEAFGYRRLPALETSPNTQNDCYLCYIQWKVLYKYPLFFLFGPPLQKFFTSIHCFSSSDRLCKQSPVERARPLTLFLENDISDSPETCPTLRITVEPARTKGTPR